MSANDKTGVGGRGQGGWQTPPELYAWLKRRFAFDFDLFASEENALAPSYATDHGVWEEWMPLLEGVTGLDCHLGDRRVFANPPYTNGFIAQAVDSMIERREQAGIIVALLPAATDTQWFHRLYAVSHTEFLPRRVRFIHPMTRCVLRDGTLCTHALGAPGESPPGGHMISILRQDMP